MKPRTSDDTLPIFFYEEGLAPEQVDWLGQKHQIDLAKRHGLSQVVLVSSRGVTDPNNRLNAIGNGKILLWKRKAEEYLADSGLYVEQCIALHACTPLIDTMQHRTYTIIHPGGLTDAPPGQRQLVVTKDDAEPAGATRVVSRADLAAVVVAALGSPHAVNKSFDLISMPDGEGSPTTNMDALLQEATEGL